MIDVDSIARFFIQAGITLALLGRALMVLGEFSFLGRLPGDFTYHRGTWTIHFPFATCIVISLVFSILVALLGRRGW